MANETWQEEERKFLSAIEAVRIPNETLQDVSKVELKDIEDVNKIPEGGGSYWIWTNEPVLHSLHKNKTPEPFDNGQIIYNGIAKDDVRGRIRHHLFGEVDADWSGISLDIYFGDTVSHRKKALSEKGKVPYIEEDYTAKRAIRNKGIEKGFVIKRLKPIRNKEDFCKLFLSDEEKAWLETTEYEKIFFRNGVDIREQKHSCYQFRVYYITGLSSLYLDFIEKKWRADYGLPKLCSYIAGR